MLDIDQWPDGTQQILVYLLKQEQKGDDADGWANRGEIARATNLNKEQVRYRVENLEDAGHLIKDYVEMVDQQFAVYSLREESRKAAEAIAECVDVLGEIPEEPTQDDILHLTYEIASIRSDYDFTSDGDPVPEYIVEIQEHVEMIDELSSEIEQLKEADDEQFERTLDGFRSVDETHEKILHRMKDLEDRVDEIEK